MQDITRYILLFACSILFAETALHADENSAYQYLLITDGSDFRAALEPLVQRRTDQGKSGKLVTVTEISTLCDGIDIQEKIRNYIKEHFYNPDPSLPQWICLGGDETIVPVRYCQENISTDLYYADVDGVDWDKDGDGIFGESEDVGLNELTPELFIGRLPFHDPKQVESYLTKLERYENYDQNSFIDTFLLLSGSGFGDCSEGSLRPERYRDHEPVSGLEIAMTDPYYDLVQPYWQPGFLGFFFDTNTSWDDVQYGDFDLTAPNILEIMNTGFHYIYYWNHSNKTTWTFVDEDFSSRFNHITAQSLSNQFPSIIFARGCGTAYYDISGVSMSERLLENPNGGAIAIYGHSRSAGGSPHWDQLLKEKFQHHYTTLGQVHNACLTSLAANKVGDPYHQYIFILLGDPAIEFLHQRTRTLQLFSPRGNEFIEAGSDLTIRWNAAGEFSPEETVKLEYSDDNGAEWIAIPGAENVTYNAGAFTWQNCPLPSGSQYRVRITSNLTPSLSSESAKSFTLGEFGVLTVSSTPMERIRIDGTYQNMTDYSCNAVLGQEVLLIAPEVMGELSFRRWADAKGNTLAENRTLSFIFEHDQEVTAEYEYLNEIQYYYVNDDIPEHGIAAGSDSADGRTKSSPKRSIQSVLTTYSDIGLGDIIYVSDGVYSEAIVIDQTHHGLTIEGRSPEFCIFTEQDYICYLKGVNQFYVRNLRFENVGTGIVSDSSGVFIENCIFKNNDARALFCFGDCNTTIRYSRFIANSRAGRGGAIMFKNHSYTDISKLHIKNCIFEANSANKAGAIFLTGGLAVDAKITNSTFYGNTAAVNAGAIKDIDTILTIRNNIFWGNSSPMSPSLLIGGRASITHCSIEGGFGGLGNIDVDPQFAGAGYVSDNQTPDDLRDDFWVEGDYHLKSEAGRWLPGHDETGDWVHDDITSSCIDTGNPGCPLADEPAAANNIRINTGAYGGTSEASRTPYNWYKLSDVNNDGTVDSFDLTTMVEYWLDNDECLPVDLNRDGAIDILDFAVTANEWLSSGGGMTL